MVQWMVVVDTNHMEREQTRKRPHLAWDVAPLQPAQAQRALIVVGDEGIGKKVPKIEKVVVNYGIGDAKGLEAAMDDLALITGHRPIKTRARASIATFKMREGQPLGIVATLRGNMMYSFLGRVVNLGLPWIRDFQGVNPNSFDGHGNYSLGVKDQGVFLEIRYDAVGKPRGMSIL